jgi:regulatory protein
VGARERALRLLGIRPRGKRELARALEQRGFEPAAVSRALHRLEAEGWLDELGAAASTVRLRGARYGPRRIERELAARGFARDTIAAALGEIDPAVEERTLARALRKVWTRHSALPRRERRRRAIDALTRRGFAAEKVSEMIDRLGRDDEVERGPRALS